MKESPFRHSMMRRRIISAVLFLLSGAGCARQENPFAPKAPDSAVSYSCAGILTGCDMDESGKLSIRIALRFDSPYIVDALAAGSWNESVFPEIPADYFSSEIRRKGDYSYAYWHDNYIENPASTNDSFLPAISDFWISGVLAEYGFTYPAVYMRVVDPPPSSGLSLRRYYRVAATDLYGRQSISVVSFRPVRATLTLKNPFNTIEVRHVGAGHEESASGSEYTVRFFLSDSELYDLYQMSPRWVVTNAAVTDLSGKSINFIMPPQEFVLEKKQ